jgi:hypothetical protein
VSAELTLAGPPGDLTNVLKAEKDVQDIRAKANKETADTKAKATKEKGEKDVAEIKPKAPKDKDESKSKAPKDDNKPKQPRTIAIAPRPRANSASDAAPPEQVNLAQTNPAHFNPVHLKETSSGPVVLSPLPEFHRELPAIPNYQSEGPALPSVLQPATPGVPYQAIVPGQSYFAEGPQPVPMIPMPDLSEPGWTSLPTGLRRSEGKLSPAMHEKGKTPSHARSSPKSSSKPLFTNEPLGSPSPASGSQMADIDMIEPGSAIKAPRKSKLAQEIRPEDARPE